MSHGKRTYRCVGTWERRLRASGFALIAGVDEAGRGSLFGPVYAAAVILPPDCPIRGLRDSKELDARRREEMAAAIRKFSISWSVASVDAFIIDRINIYQASLLAMKRAVEQLEARPDCLLLDAVRIDLPLPQTPIIHGDARCQSIAAASILAKTARDACMRQWDSVFPAFGLARHKGYTTAEHVAALSAHGPTVHHRFSFEPVRASCTRAVRLLLASREWFHFRWDPWPADDSGTADPMRRTAAGAGEWR